MKNLPHLLFRLDTNPPVPTATTAKANPLDSIEIDGNFKSIYNSLQSIPDILSSGDIVAGTALNNLVDHKGMIQYVDKEIASINIPVIDIVQSSDIKNTTGLNKIVDHKGMIQYVDSEVNQLSTFLASGLIPPPIDITTSGDIVAHSGLDKIVDHKSMIQYVDQEMSGISAPTVDIVTSTEIVSGSGLSKIVSHERMIQYVDQEMSGLASGLAPVPIDIVTATDITAGSGLTKIVSHERMIQYVDTEMSGLSAMLSSGLAPAPIDIVTSTEITTGSGLTKIVSHERMIQYVGMELSGLSIPDVDIVTSAEIQGGTGLNKIVDHERMIEYVDKELSGLSATLSSGLAPIPIDIVTSTDITTGSGLDKIVDHKSMIQYVDQEMSGIAIPTLNFVTSSDITTGSGLDKIVDHKGMIQYSNAKFTEFENKSDVICYIDSVAGSDSADGKTPATAWKTFTAFALKYISTRFTNITIYLKGGPSENIYTLIDNIYIRNSLLNIYSYGSAGYTFPRLSFSLNAGGVANTVWGAGFYLLNSHLHIRDISIETPSIGSNTALLINIPTFGDNRFKYINDHPGCIVMDANSSTLINTLNSTNRYNLTIRDGLLFNGSSPKMCVHSARISKTGTGFLFYPTVNNNFEEWNCVLLGSTKYMTPGVDPVNDIIWYLQTNIYQTSNLLYNNLSTNGYQYLAGGLIIQWGSYTEWDEVERPYDFPIEFPTAALNITCGNNNPRYMSYATIINKKSFKVASRDLDPGTADSGGAIYSYFAIGY